MSEKNVGKIHGARTRRDFEKGEQILCIPRKCWMKEDVTMGAGFEKFWKQAVEMWAVENFVHTGRIWGDDKAVSSTQSGGRSSDDAGAGDGAREVRNGKQEQRRAELLSDNKQTVANLDFFTGGADDSGSPCEDKMRIRALWLAHERGLGEGSFYHPYLQTLPSWEELEGVGMPVFGLLREMEEGAGEGGAGAGADRAEGKRGSEGGVL